MPVTGEKHGVINLDNNEFFSYEFIQRCWSLRSGRRCVAFSHELAMWAYVYRARGFPVEADRLLNNSDRLIATAFSYRAMVNPDVNSTFKCHCPPGIQRIAYFQPSN